MHVSKVEGTGRPYAVFERWWLWSVLVNTADVYASNLGLTIKPREIQEENKKLHGS